MRTLKELATSNRRVWFYIKDEALGHAFMNQAEEEGFHWANEKAMSKDDWYYTMAIRADMSLWYVSLYVWTLSFRGNIEGTPIRVDYEKYVSGCEDYICHESHFRGTVRFS